MSSVHVVLGDTSRRCGIAAREPKAGLSLGGGEGTQREFSRILSHPRFLMAEIEIQDIPERPGNLRFSDGWRVETLLDYPLDQPEEEHVS